MKKIILFCFVMYIIFIQSPLDNEKCSFIDYRYNVMPHEEYPNISIMGMMANEKSFWLDLSQEMTPEEAVSILGKTHYNLMRKSTSYKTISCDIWMCKRTDEMAKQVNFINSWSDAVIKRLKITQSTSIREAVIKINNFLCDYLSYSKDDERGDLITAINNNCGICAVYSSLFQILCQKCGIECYFIHDVEHNHAYNMIVSSSGTKYYIDPTWNDDSNNKYLPKKHDVKPLTLVMGI